MSSYEPSFEELLTRVQAGDNEAVGTLFQLYSDPVRRVVRRLLHFRLRRRYDSSDFVQSVWASFADLSHQAYEFRSPEDLVKFLSRMAYNKVMETTRKRLATKKHGGGVQEVSLHREPTPPVLPAREHTPSQYVIADERWQKLIEGLPPRHVQVLQLLRDGHSKLDIAQQLNISPKIIQRLLHRLRHFRDQA